ncbi:carbohydrate binding domain-containing protein [Teredinibacter franksiae]|uniref:carbohydrate binding domain-containing protein n=1 Tax=Teredinibacter franksiae TaxID=2761453 RepID=UPI001626A5D9|nr:carbohydrate binding domain-containing protein [Teredinibacter franksiae]
MFKISINYWFFLVLLLAGCGGGGSEGGTNSIPNPTSSPVPDFDADGISDALDSDDDNDGAEDSADAFPKDASEQLDTDGDGVGNNADNDDDNDGVTDDKDQLPLDASDSVDTDGDGIGNSTDLDDDGDGVVDSLDPFPLDASESLDTDNDGIGNTADTDDDNDGVIDIDDQLPFDDSEYLDTDSDDLGNNTDRDDDGDGVSDEHDQLPLDGTEALDSDVDGVGDNADTQIEHFVYYKNKIGRWDAFVAWDNLAGNYNMAGADSHITWQEESTSDPSHERVLRVKFNKQLDGNFFIIERFNSPYDFSSYAEGAVTFDIFPQSYGQSVNSLLIGLDCVWPCTGGVLSIGRPPLNVWSNIRVSLDEFVAAGLDLSNVNTALKIMPTAGEQQGVEFLLDNVRWESAQAKGLIDNPGFEDALPTNAIRGWDETLQAHTQGDPASRWSWYLQTASADFSIVTAAQGQVRTGGHSLKIDVNSLTAPVPEAWHALVDHEAIPVETGKTYSVSFWLYAEGGDATVKTGVQLPAEFDHAYKVVNETTISAGVWTNISFDNVSFEADETEAVLSFHLGYPSNEGVSVYIDDIVFE